MKNKILLDVDGVLLDYETEFCKYFDLNYNNSKRYQNFEDAFGLSRITISEMVFEFNSSDSMKSIPPREYAVDTIDYLIKHGFEFHLITSCGDDNIIMQNRKENLDNVFGKNTFDNVSYLPVGDDKRKYLKQYSGSGYLWVEDNINNFFYGQELGLNSILIKTDFNLHPYNINMVDNWKELSNFIKNWYQIDDKK